MSGYVGDVTGSVFLEWLQFIFLYISVRLAVCFYVMHLSEELFFSIFFNGEEFGIFPAVPNGNSLEREEFIDIEVRKKVHVLIGGEAAWWCSG